MITFLTSMNRSARRSLGTASVPILLAAVLAAPASAQSSLTLDGTNDYDTFGNALGTPTVKLECWFRRSGTGATGSVDDRHGQA